MKNHFFTKSPYKDRTNTVHRPGYELAFDGRGGLVWVPVGDGEPEVLEIEAEVVETVPTVIYEQQKPSLVTHRYAVVLYLVLGLMGLALALAPAIERGAKVLVSALGLLVDAVAQLVLLLVLVLGSLGFIYALYRAFARPGDTTPHPEREKPTAPTTGVTFNIYVNNNQPNQP